VSSLLISAASNIFSIGSGLIKKFWPKFLLGLKPYFWQSDCKYVQRPSQDGCL